MPETVKIVVEFFIGTPVHSRKSTIDSKGLKTALNHPGRAVDRRLLTTFYNYRNFKRFKAMTGVIVLRCWPWYFPAEPSEKEGTTEIIPKNPALGLLPPHLAPVT